MEAGFVRYRSCLEIFEYVFCEIVLRARERIFKMNKKLKVALSKVIS